MGESKVGMETDAFAIADCMGSGAQAWAYIVETWMANPKDRYIKPDIQTIAIGQAGVPVIVMTIGSTFGESHGSLLWLL